MKSESSRALRITVILLTAVSLQLTGRAVEPEQIVIQAVRWDKSYDDDLKAWFNNQLGFKGELIYIFDNPRLKPDASRQIQKSYLTVRTFGQSRQEGGSDQDATSSTLYEIQSPFGSFIYEPQFSTDGQYVLFKVGDPYNSFGTYQLCLWNLETRRLRVVTGGLGYRTLAWSHDSRYFTYIHGAIRQPFVGGRSPAHLHLYDVQTSETQLVSENELIRDSVAWTTKGTLLYSVKSSSPQQIPKRKLDKDGEAQMKNAVALYPDIYEMTAADGKTRLMTRDAYKPTPSPDGKWLAFFSSQSPAGTALQPVRPPSEKTSTEYARGPFLVLSNSIGEQRVLLRREPNPIASSLFLDPNSQRIIIDSSLRSE